MIKITLTVSFLLILLARSKSKEFNFIARSEMLTKDRDGILIYNLQNGEKATICNVGFTDQYANIVCNNMGYPMKGITMLSKKSHLAENMKMVSIKCPPYASSFKECSMITEGRVLRKCQAKSKIAHVLCLGKKIKPIVKKLTALTNCNKNHDLLNFVKLKGKRNTGFLQIKQTLNHNFRFVCNSHLNFGMAAARLFCNLLCSNPSNPRPVMFINPGEISVTDGYFRDLVCPNYASSISQCSNFIESTTCDKVFNLALKCGAEIAKQDPLPNILCSNRSIIIEWSTEQALYLNASLVSLHLNHTKDCLYSRKNSKNKVIIKIPLDYCNPIITDNIDSIKYQYTLNRKFVGDGLVQFKNMESIDVYCRIKKLNEINKEYTHNVVTYPPVISNTFLRLNMTLHSGSDFEELLPQPYDIQFYEPVYVKVTIFDQLNQVKLSLNNCFVTSALSYSEMNSKNSAKIINENCPVEKYGAEIVPLNKWSIAFQFTSFKIEESNKASFNIFCETIKCLIGNDPQCGICKVGLHRKKRSANITDNDFIMAGPILFH